MPDAPPESSIRHDALAATEWRRSRASLDVHRNTVRAGIKRGVRTIGSRRLMFESVVVISSSFLERAVRGTRRRAGGVSGTASTVVCQNLG